MAKDRFDSLRMVPDDDVSKVSAILNDNDPVALGTIRAILDAGVAIPRMYRASGMEISYSDFSASREAGSEFGYVPYGEQAFAPSDV